MGVTWSGNGGGNDVIGTELGKAWDAVTGHATPPSTTTGPIPDQTHLNQALIRQLVRSLQGNTAQQQTGFSQEQQTFGNEGNLAAMLTALATGGGPSPAQQQLQQGLQQETADQLSAASGVGGENAALAGRKAMDNIAREQIGTNNSASLLRANEELGAYQNLSSLMNAMAGQSLNAAQAGQAGYNANIGGVESLSGQNMSGAIGLTNAVNQTNQQNAQSLQKLLNSIIGGAAGGAAQGAGGSGSSAGGGLGPLTAPTSADGVATLAA